MSSDPTHGLPPDLLDRARRVRLVGFDVDGTLTDGRLFFDDAGRESKAFHVQDGLGLMNWLREQGLKIPVVAISGHHRTSEFDGLSMARRLGAASILEKPFPAGALAAAVDSALLAA